MTNLAKYLVSLEAQSKQYVAELDKANKQLSKFHQQQTKAIDSIATGFKVLGGVIAVKMFAGYIKDSIDAADNTAKLSQKVGIAVQTLQGMALGADLAGVSAEGLNSGIIKLARSMSDAAQGLSTQKRAFADLGVSVQNADGTLRSTESVLRDVADRFAETGDGARKAALAQEIFGRAGADLIPLLNDGSKGLDEMIDRARKLGIVWSGEAAQAAERFNDSLTILSAIGHGFSSTLAQQLLPSLNAVTDALIGINSQSQATTSIATGLAAILKPIAGIAIALSYGLVSLAERLAGTAAAIAALATDGPAAAQAVISEMRATQHALEAEMNSALASLSDNAHGTTQALADVSRQAKQTFGAVAEASKTEAIDKQVQALITEANTFGMTSGQATLYKLALAGATAQQLEMAQGALNLTAALEAEKKALFVPGSDAIGPGQQGPTRAPEDGLDEIAAEKAMAAAADNAAAIDAINKKKSENAIQYARAETQATIEAQQQQLDFRASVAQASAQLLQGVFGQSKAIQLAAIAFEKLMAVRRVKIAVDLAAWQAFQSQLIPGDPTSMARAQAAYAATKARGAITVAQTVALSVVSGLAEAASTLQSSGALGSFTNPISTQPGSATAPGAGVDSASRHRNTVQLYMTGNTFLGWDDTIRRKFVSTLRDLLDNQDVVIFGPGSAQAQVLLGG